MEVPAGQVNFRGSLPPSENNVLQPMSMLHPVIVIILNSNPVFLKVLDGTSIPKV